MAAPINQRVFANALRASTTTTSPLFYPDRLILTTLESRRVSPLFGLFFPLPTVSSRHLLLFPASVCDQDCTISGRISPAPFSPIFSSFLSHRRIFQDGSSQVGQAPSERAHWYVWFFLCLGIFGGLEQSHDVDLIRWGVSKKKESRHWGKSKGHEKRCNGVIYCFTLDANSFFCAGYVMTSPPIHSFLLPRTDSFDRKAKPQKTTSDIQNSEN